MPTLGDLIGALLSDVANARVRADWETVKIAETYAAHDLLKYMPVPRFRLPEVSVDIPVVVDQVEVGGEPDPIYQKPAAREISELVRKSLLQVGVRVPAPQRRKVYLALHRKVDAIFSRAPQVLLSTRKLAREVEQSALQQLSPTFKELKIPPEQVTRLGVELRGRMADMLLGKLLQSPTLQVKAASSDVREYQTSDALLRIRLTITEDAFELVHEDKDGMIISKLVPE